MPLLRETDLENICGGCREVHDNHFSSTWDETTFNAHYKIKECENCGYEISFRTTDGSGITTKG
ncbi:MAG: hypothetical protein H8D38_00435 [DPANN group archaeon]|nr:hypothetical protein [DPANN group archaeon]